MHTSGTVEPRRPPHRPWPVLPLPIRPSKLFLCHPVFLLHVRAQPFLSGNGSGWYAWRSAEARFNEGLGERT